jgi:hypothetical protein
MNELMDRLDLVQPQEKTFIQLKDLKRCASAGLVFDMIFDLNKYDTHMRRIDPLFREYDDVWVVDKIGQRVKLR